MVGAVVVRDGVVVGEGWHKRFGGPHAEIINEGTSYVLELCFLTHRAGGRIVQIGVGCEDWRKSKFNLVHEAFYKYSHLIGLWLRNRTGRI